MRSSKYITVYEVRKVRCTLPLHAIGCYFTDHPVVCSGLHCIRSPSQTTAINAEDRRIEYLSVGL
jgi:hypothetical protein